MTTHQADRLATWRRLLEESSAALRAAAARTDPGDVKAVAHLRKSWPADLVAAAIELAAARRKAQDKFPDGERLVTDVPGIEQATSYRVAEHKARRFAQALADLRAPCIVDLCCGIGGDAMSLARVGDVRAIDISPLRAWMTHRNAGCPAEAADAETLDLQGEVFHLDPARRDDAAGAGDSRRFWRYEDYRPGPAFIDRLLTTCPDGAIKLGPGVDLDALPSAPSALSGGGGGGEIEIINEGGTLVQAVLWCGRLAVHPGKRTATRLPEGLSFTAAPQPLTPRDDAPAKAFDRFLYVPDPAIERADLLGALCRDLPVREAHPGLGILTSAEPVEVPWLSGFEVLAQLPWRPRKIRDWLKAHDGGLIEVKTRGKAIDTDFAQHDLRGAGREPYTIFALRLGRKITAVIARPVSD